MNPNKQMVMKTVREYLNKNVSGIIKGYLFIDSNVSYILEELHYLFLMKECENCLFKLKRKFECYICKKRICCSRQKSCYSCHKLICNNCIGETYERINGHWEEYNEYECKYCYEDKINYSIYENTKYIHCYCDFLDVTCHYHVDHREPDETKFANDYISVW